MDLVCQVYVLTSSDDSRVDGIVCWKSVIEPSFLRWCNGVMDSARDFYLLGDSVRRFKSQHVHLPFGDFSIRYLF